MPGAAEGLGYEERIERLPSGTPEEHSTETSAPTLRSSALPNNEPLNILRSSSPSIRANRLPALVRSRSEGQFSRPDSTPGTPPDTPLLAPTPLRPGSSTSFHLGTRRWSSPGSRPEDRTEDAYIPNRNATVSPLSFHLERESSHLGASNHAHGTDFDSRVSRTHTPVSDRFTGRPRTPFSEAGDYETSRPETETETSRPSGQPLPPAGFEGLPQPAGDQYRRPGGFDPHLPPPQLYQPPTGAPPGSGGPQRYPSAFDPANPANRWANTPQPPMYNNPMYNNQGYPQQNKWMNRLSTFANWGSQLGDVAINIVSSFLHIIETWAKAVESLSKGRG